MAPLTAEEFPGAGVSASWRGGEVRLGSVAWCGAEAEAAAVAAVWPDASLIALRTPDHAVVFAVRAGLALRRQRDGGRHRRATHEVEILSGDREAAVALVAQELGVQRWQAGLQAGRQDRPAGSAGGGGAARR